MTDLKKYKIDIFNLPSGSHGYEFEFGDDFFENFENSLINNGQGLVKVNLNKSETFLELDFEIDGAVELICDRSLDRYDYPVRIQKELLIKFGDENDTSDDEIIFVPWKTQTLLLGQYIYEYLSLEVPMKKLHPRYEKDLEEEEDTKLIYSSKTESFEEPIQEEIVDPRWEKLKELKEIEKKQESKK